MVLISIGSMKDTACWKINGVCVSERLCKGSNFLTEVPGCKNKLEVCCFGWNQYRIRFADMEIPNSYYPWKNVKTKAFNGKGLLPAGKTKHYDDQRPIMKSKKLHEFDIHQTKRRLLGVDEQ